MRTTPGRDADQIVQYWHSPDIPQYIAPLLDSFGRLNPWARHLVFDESAATQFIAHHFSDREVGAFRSCAVPAMQADYFRYCALLATGGVYADADMLCVGDLRALLGEGPEDGSIFRRPNTMIMNGFFAFRAPQSAFLRLVLDVATANIEQRVAEDVWLATGPGIFTYLSMLHQAGSFAAFEATLKDDDYEAVPRFGKLMCKTAGSFDRIAASWACVRIREEAELRPYAVDPDVPMPYKETEVHWTRVSGSIFRGMPPDRST